MAGEFNGWLKRNMDSIFANDYAAKMNQFSQQSQQQSYEAEIAQVGDPQDPSASTTLKSTYSNLQSVQSFSGSRPLRPGDVTTIVGKRSF